MHHLVVQSNFVDTGPEATKNRFGGKDSPVCPKPRSPGSGAIPELLKPHKCSRHSRATSEGRSGILNMITEKTTDEQEPVCIGCMPTCYLGSPPSRTDNPLVHDVQFGHQMDLLSPFTQAKLSDKVWLRHLSISSLKFGFGTSASLV